MWKNGGGGGGGQCEAQKCNENHARGTKPPLKYSPDNHLDVNCLKECNNYIYTNTTLVLHAVSCNHARL